MRTAYLMPRPASILRTRLYDEYPSSPDNKFVFASPVTGRVLTEHAIDKRIQLYAWVAHERCPDVPPKGLHPPTLARKGVTLA